MIVRRLTELLGTERDVPWGNGQSRRLLVARDGMGFGFTDTTVHAGTRSTMQYRNHLMSAYVVSGTGRLEAEGGTIHELGPGTMYALDRHDKYTLHAESELRVLCIFNPPLEGTERHDLNRPEASSY